MVEQAIALNPNLAMAWYSRGWVALMCGKEEAAIESFDRMIRLSPLDPLRILAWNGCSFAFFNLGRFEQGCQAGMKSVQFEVDAHTLAAYAVNLVGAGRAEEAREAIARLLKRQPDFRLAHAKDAFPVRSPVTSDRIVAALREAGLPD